MEAQKIKYTCLGRMLPDGNRKGCGFDLTPIIDEVPFDGEVHELECPRCGNPFTVRRGPEEQLEEQAAASEE